MKKVLFALAVIFTPYAFARMTYDKHLTIGTKSFRFIEGVDLTPALENGDAKWKAEELMSMADTERQVLEANGRMIEQAQKHLDVEMKIAEIELTIAEKSKNAADITAARDKIKTLKEKQQQLDMEKLKQFSRGTQENALREQAAKRAAHITQDETGTGAQAGAGSPANPGTPGETLTMTDPIKGGDLDTTNLKKISGTNYYKASNGETFFKGADGKLYRTDNPAYQSQFGKPEQGTAAQLKGLKQYDPESGKWNDWTGGGQKADGSWSHGFGGTAGNPASVWESGNGSGIAQSTKPFSSNTHSAFNNFGKGFTGKSGFSTPEYSSTQTGALRSAFTYREHAESAARTHFGSWTDKYTLEHNGNALKPEYRIVPRAVSAATTGSNLSEQTVLLEIP